MRYKFCERGSQLSDRTHIVGIVMANLANITAAQYRNGDCYDKYLALINKSNENYSLSMEDFCEEDAAISRMKEIVTLFFTCFNIVIAIGIVIGNTIVLVAYVKYAFVRTVQNTLLLNMSMADLLTAPAIIMANVLTNFFLYNEEIKIPCLGTAWLMAVCFEAQIWMLLLVTVNRWISIRYPLRHHIMFNKRTAVILTVTIWLTLMSVDTGCSVNNIWAPGKKCYPFRVVTPLCYKILVYPFILLPLLLTPIVYIVLTRFAFLHNKKMKAHIQSTTDPTLVTRSKEIKTLKTLGIILGILYISWVPTFLLSFVWTIEPDTYGAALAQKLFRNTATSCLYLGSLVNPLVYHRSSPSFRKAFLMMFERKNKNKKSNATSSGNGSPSSSNNQNKKKRSSQSDQSKSTDVSSTPM